MKQSRLRTACFVPSQNHWSLGFDVMRMISTQICCQVVKTWFEFHLRECMGSSPPHQLHRSHQFSVCFLTYQYICYAGHIDVHLLVYSLQLCHLLKWLVAKVCALNTNGILWPSESSVSLLFSWYKGIFY